MNAPSTNAMSETILVIDFPEKYPTGSNSPKRTPAATSAIVRTAKTKNAALRKVYLPEFKSTFPPIWR